MTVRARTLLVVSLAMLLLLVGQYAGLRWAFVRAINRLENDGLAQQVHQAASEIRDTIGNIDSVAADYAAWDKTYAYVAKPDPEFVESDLADEALRRLRLDAVVLVDPSGRLVLFRSLLEGPDLEAVRATLVGALKPGSRLATFPTPDASHQGLIPLGTGAIAVAVRPILTSDGTGPSRGSLLMARRLGDQEIARVGQTIHLSVALVPLAPTAAPSEVGGVRVNQVSAERLVGESPLADIDGAPRWLVRVSSGRPLLEQGERWFLYFVLAFLISVIIVALVTIALIDRIVLRRLSRMSHAVTNIGLTGDLTQKVFSGGRDELSAVGTSIDAMLDSIRESRAAAEHSALEASRLKSEFLANMSHEIRTPLNGVLGTLRILEDTPLNTDQQDLIRTTLTCAEGLLGLLNDVLDLSKIEAGRMALVCEPVDVRKVAEEALMLFGPLIGVRPIDLLLQVDPAVPSRIMGDHGRLRQVLVNLIGNAVKFTQQGHVLVDVACSPLDRGRELNLTVSDTGIGIPAEKMTAVFESFTQVDVATTRRFGGTGLGLTITRRLLTLMNGTVTVASEPGQGSTFTCRIPLVEGSPVEGAGASGQALLVDVPGIRRDVHAGVLRHLGLLVVEAGTLAEAVARSSTLTPETAVILVQPPVTAEAQAAIALLSSRHRQLAVVVRARHAPLPRAAQAAQVLVQPVVREQWLRMFGMGASSKPVGHVSHFDAHVLLAEDNPVNKMVAVALLRKLGCSTDTADNGREAVERAARTRYDVIFMDCEMPVMDGYEATAAIRQQASPPRSGTSVDRIPIVALTAHAMSEARARCEQAGMDGFVTKPFKLEELEAVLQQYCRPSQPAAQ